ncbi:GNAT family N-acetyltransferase [Rhizosphaericola mali]|uniref:GNAT family N-acetyltransferase n=1 Tax=Rhizosphaericola mali TaxID=2545455 RepID=A0A5P2G5P2_9BACT|nr:GNAT family N-acetyltransferase [Rhizosphaericola mali]QES90008.1 GNAT family N-acetyltransferase [Rhizosphaericola mali]
MELIFKIFEYNSPDYVQQVALRSAVLRAPLGLKFSPADLEKDAENIMFGAFLDNEILGCCQFKILNETQVQLRQMAVDPAIQGQSIGRRLVAYAEEYAKRHRYKCIELHARKVAMLFYQKLGYMAVGEEFEEVGIPHFCMEKQL